jgi:hypothetical protein
MSVISATRTPGETLLHPLREIHIDAEIFTGLALQRRTRMCESKKL